MCESCRSLLFFTHFWLIALDFSTPAYFPRSAFKQHTGPGGWNDADFIYTGGEGCADNKPLEHCPGQTDTEYRTEFSMWCIMGSSLLIATDIRNMTDIMKEVC